MSGTHIFAFGCVKGDLGPVLRKNMDKTEKWSFDSSSFPLGFSKKLLYIRYQDLRLGYAHVEFQPDCSNGVDSTAFGRFETFSALAILCLHGSL